MNRFIISIRCLHTFRSIEGLLTRSLHPQAVKSSLSLSSPYLVDQAYSLFLKSGHALDAHVATSLITHFAKSGDFSRSLQFLLDTQDPDIVAFNALLSGYARFHVSAASFSLYSKLTCSGLVPNCYTLSSLIKSCDNIDQIRIVHVFCIKLGLNSSSFVVGGLVGRYARYRSLESSEKCFQECLFLDEVVWTAMINGYIWNGEFENGREAFVVMEGLGFELNEFSLTTVLGALLDVKEGEQIHGFAVKMGFLSGSLNHLSNAIMSMYCRCRSSFDAVKVFDEIPEPDVVSWTVRISAARDGMEAFEMFNLLRSGNLEANELTFINILSVMEGPKLLKPGRQVHLLSCKLGYIVFVSIANALISMYGKCGEMNDAILVFDELVCHDSVSWNSLIGGYAENELIGPALSTFSQMRDCCLEPDKYTLASILVAASNSNFGKLVMQIHSYVIKIGFMSDDSMLSCLITSYSKCNRIENAKKVFAETEIMNAGHLQVVTSAAVNSSCPAVALELFKSTRSSFSESDRVTLSIVLKACSALTNLAEGQAIHSLVLKSGISDDSFIESALIDVYCKCGCISDSEKVFRDINKDNLAAWNAMIMGYSQHGLYHEVLDLFKMMTGLGLKPDEITFLGILTSCCHAQLVNEAHVHLYSMFKLHGVAPCLEHYACVIDLLGRVGLIEEAKMMIDQMPVSPDAQIWQILLSACSIYGKLDLGKVAAMELLKLHPDNDSAYVLLSGLYAKASNWDAVRRLRKEMKNEVKYKEPGYSWIEIGKFIYYFLAEDTSHTEIELIYQNLHSLSMQILPLYEVENVGVGTLM
ncbi:hypothetical protein Nepgr_024527 [Nepenthes gracilis]|uniref:Pentatricopeptide repeat-containing protein n=1 Tax=Nepenthes gracilis TaxID=150966 RepID=A0AAD3T5D2_NEPGR|nr:hypothetical protein Nepgr_024527 [Nepenthes gracilis]